MYGFCRKGNFICLITEFVRGGNLADCLANRDKYGLDLRLQIELALSIARGMVYLHSMNVIHRDLKPANILVSIRFVVLTA
jgi:serine/threonine protein kinase